MAVNNHSIFMDGSFGRNAACKEDKYISRISVYFNKNKTLPLS
jgi:hypothetical protein